MLAEKNEAIREAAATIKKLNADERIKMQCEAREQLEHDMAGAYHHGIRQGREEGISAFVETCKELGIPEQEMKEKLQDKFKLSEQEVKRYIEKY